MSLRNSAGTQRDQEGGKPRSIRNEGISMSQTFDDRISQAVATELWRVASSRTQRGEGLLWLLAQVTAADPDLPVEVATRRVADAILSARPEVWAHARSGA
jgi:hypothetical protein